MKKILLLLLLTISGYGQVSTNQEFPADYGIIIPIDTLQTVTTPSYIATFGNEGVIGKIPSTYIAKTQEVKAALDLKQTVFTGICQEQYLTENDIVIDNTALTLTIATVKNGQAISSLNPICFYTDGSGIAVKHEKTAPVVFNFTNTTGVWYFYFNSSGQPIATQTVWNEFATIATVFRFYWNATLPTADKCVIQSTEFHKNDISWTDHSWKHAQGTQYVSGFDISSNKIISGTPAIDGSNAVISISSGTNIDDNMAYTLTNAASGTVKFTQNLGTGLLPATSGKFITISNDAAGLLQKIPAADFPFLWNSGTNTPEYLTPTGVRTPVTANYFFVYYVYALQDPRRGETIKIKSAEIDFANTTLAAAHSWEQLQAIFPTLRDGEIRLLYKLTFEYKTAFDIGTKKTALRTIDDLRKQKTTTSAVASGIVPATNVSVSPVGGIASTNAQSALQELDGEKENVANKSDSYTASSSTTYASTKALVDGLGTTVKLTGDQTITGVKTFSDIKANTLSKKTRTDVNYVFEGDSRVAGGASTDWPYKLQSLSNFANTGDFYNVATGGERIWQIVSEYATEVYPRRPIGGITESYLFVLVGINDLVDADPNFATMASDLLAYCNTAKADGFKIVLFTTFYRQDFTRAQELARLKFNELLRQGKSNYYMLIDTEDLFPPSSSSIFYADVVHLTESGNNLIADYVNNRFPLGNSGNTIVSRNSLQDVLTPYTELKIDGNFKSTGYYLQKGQLDAFTYNLLELEAPNAATSKWSIITGTDNTFNITQGGGYTNIMKIDASGNVRFNSTVSLSTTPTTSAGTYRVLTYNETTDAVESVASLNFVADAITDGVTAVAPSQNAVFDALAGKASLAGAQTFASTVQSTGFITGGNYQLGSGNTGFIAPYSASFLIKNPGYWESNVPLSATSFKPTVYTVATLPTPPVTGQGTYATVSDATAPTYLGTLTGGGSVVCPVFYNGTAWVAH